MAEPIRDPEIRIRASKDMIAFLQNIVSEIATDIPENLGDIEDAESLSLTLSDAAWIREFMDDHSQELKSRCPPFKYFHELMEGCTVILPECKFPPRNPELEARIQRLKKEQEDREYRQMTQNVSGQKSFKEQPLSKQMQEMNNHLIMLLQFIVSVGAAFTFGYLAPYFFYGLPDPAPRILIGVILAFVVGIADLYFVIRYLLETEGLIKRPIAEPDIDSPKAKIVVSSDDIPRTSKLKAE